MVIGPQLGQEDEDDERETVSSKHDCNGVYSDVDLVGEDAYVKK